MSSPALLYPGFVVENRYEIVRVLGQGGFGRTYLAKDHNRFQERCVLKEFAPQVHGHYALNKAAELFQREAGVLYQLQHPQIPAFRELVQIQLQGAECLLLIEDYVDGPTYADLVQQGQRWTEPDGLQLLQDLLPVLDYLHANGVIHRDISPDNLICEQTTGKPVLIDFGSVKQVVTTAMRQFNQTPIATKIEKAGYTPIEQLNGEAFPASDLYALGVTILVLLTHKSPLELSDPHQHTWHWQPYVQISPGLATILQRMLAYRAIDRYQSVQEVLQALQSLPVRGVRPTPIAPPAIVPSAPTVSSLKTWVVAPERTSARPPDPVMTHPVAPPAYRQPPTRSPYRARSLRWLGRSLAWIVLLPFRLVIWAFRLVNGVFTWVWRLIVIALVTAVAAIAAWWFQPTWLTALPKWPTVTADQTEQSCQSRVVSRLESLSLSTKELYPKVNQRWHRKHPELQGRMLTDRPEDAHFRQEWCQMAEELLDAAEANPTEQQVNAN